MTARWAPYWLPNLFTSMTLMCGFYSVVLALEMQLDAALHAVMFSMIFDFLDGWVARKTNTVSSFGKEYDSLCDLIAFGFAPALTTYQLIAINHSISWMIPGVYCCAVASRLARFNVSEQSNNLSHFQGLPCTAAGPFLMLMCYFVEPYFYLSNVSFSFLGFVIILSYLMNSVVAYRSFKNNFRVMVRTKCFWLFAVSVAIGSVISPIITVALVLFVYIISPLFYRVKTRLEYRRKVAS